MTFRTKPSYVAEALKKRGLAARKRWGQNFLIDANIARKIVASAELEPLDWVLEIGPGLGALTALLSEAAGRVVGLEIDRQLAELLSESLTAPGLHIVQGDALQLDWERLLLDLGWSGQALKLVANLPYYLTTPLLMKALESELPFERLVVMVQKEVAARLLAAPNSKEFGVLSLAVQYYTEADLVCNAPRTVFMPAPGVDSAVVRLRLKTERPDVPRGPLFEVIRACFEQRRKQAVNALKPLAKLWGLGPPDLEQALNAAGIDPTRRGETLGLADFAVLTRELIDRRGV